MKKSPSAIQLKNMIRSSLISLHQPQVPHSSASSCRQSQNSTTCSVSTHRPSKIIYISDFIIAEETELQQGISQSVQFDRRLGSRHGLTTCLEGGKENSSVRYSKDTNQLVIDCAHLDRGHDHQFARFIKTEVDKAIDKYKQKENIKKKVRGVLGQICLNNTTIFDPK